MSFSVWSCTWGPVVHCILWAIDQRYWYSSKGIGPCHLITVANSFLLLWSCSSSPLEWSLQSASRPLNLHNSQRLRYCLINLLTFFVSRKNIGQCSEKIFFRVKEKHRTVLREVRTNKHVVTGQLVPFLKHIPTRIRLHLVSSSHLSGLLIH